MPSFPLASHAYNNHHRQIRYIYNHTLHFRNERSLFQRGAKNTGERKFSIIFAPGSRERKLAGAKVLRVFAPGSEHSVLGTFAHGSESTEERKGPFPSRCISKR